MGTMIQTTSGARSESFNRRGAASATGVAVMSPFHLARDGSNGRKRSRKVRVRQLVILIVVLFTTNCFMFAQSNPAGPDPNQSSPSNEGDDSKGPNPPSLFTPLKPQTDEAPYHPITPRQRLRWFITNTIGPPHLAGGVVVAAFGTAFDRPYEYGPHWGGFADRYGMRITGIVTGNAIEASVGFMLGEDPRYFRVQDQPLKSRLKNVVRLTFAARADDGSLRPAYARYVATFGNNFLSNTWRVPSEANTHDALLRAAEGLAGRMAFNAFEEFWPEVKSHVFHRRP